jgi:hypothetical protein
MDPNNLDTWQFAAMPRMPRNVQATYDGLRLAEQGRQGDFTDRVGNEVVVPRRQTSKGEAEMLVPFGYAQALWDFKHGDIVLKGDDAETGVLFVRDVDYMGMRRLESWTAIASLADCYDVRSAESKTEWDRLLKIECAKLVTFDGRPLRIRHGIRFANKAYCWYAEPGLREKPCIFRPGDAVFSDPFELSIDRDFEERLVLHARHFMQDITDDAKSLHNLEYLPAAPFLQQFKEKTFVLAGEGGNGKGTFFNAFVKGRSTRSLATTVDAVNLTGGAKVSSTVLEQEPAKLIGRMWAFDEDAGSLSAQQTERLKKLSTGDGLNARRLGHDMVTFRPEATLSIATNLSFVTSMDDSMKRRFVFVRMKDGRKAKDFDLMRAFISQFGADGFIMRSCQAWFEEGTPGEAEIRKVQINRPDMLTDAEQWMVSEIIARGWVYNPDNPYRPSQSDKTNAISKLGLKSKQKTVDGNRVSVYVVEDEDRFSDFRKYVMAQIENDAPTPPPEPLDGVATNPDERGFGCHYVRANLDKSCYGWQNENKARNPHLPKPPQNAAAWACVPHDGFAVLDFDMDAKGSGSKYADENGWDSFERTIGEYGTLDFPKTFLTRTPSGGVHAYYRLPEGVHVVTNTHIGGFHIDTRCEREGYVLAPGSHMDNGEESGDYRVADDSQVATMSDAMVGWLGSVGMLKPGSKGAPAPAEPMAAVHNAYDPKLDSRKGNIDGFTPVGQDAPYVIPDAAMAQGGRDAPLDIPPMTKGDTHKPMRDHALSIGGIAAKFHKSQEWIDREYRRLYDAVPERHWRTSPSDFCTCVTSACEMSGITTNCPLHHV